MKKGFTLIELVSAGIITIVIFMILASLVGGILRWK